MRVRMHVSQCGLFDINGCDAVSDECERMVKLFKKFKPNDGLLDDCCCCSCGGGGGSNGEEGRLDPDEFIGGVELLDLDDNVLRFDGAASCLSYLMSFLASVISMTRL